MRIATYNVEWFTSLFDDKNHLIADAGWSGRHNVTRLQQTEALGLVFAALDADAVMVIEAPDSNRKRSGRLALENFAARFDLRTSKALIGFENNTQQEITLLYDPAVLSARHDPRGGASGDAGTGDAPRFDGQFHIDLNVDAAPEMIRFSKPPLEVALTTAAGSEIRLIGVHAKSKAPHGARGADQVLRVSIDNRRKQLAQCIWLRSRVDQHLKAGEALMVLGDLNDGPGLDEYEKLFGRSGVEIVLGEAGKNALFDPHAQQVLDQSLQTNPTTARFYLHHEKRYLSALLDYIMISPELRRKSPKWRIWHPFDDPVCSADPVLQPALLAASDHFPVTLDIDL